MTIKPPSPRRSKAVLPADKHLCRLGLSACFSFSRKNTSSFFGIPFWKKTMLPPSVCSDSKHLLCPSPSRSKNAKLSYPTGNSPSENAPAAMIGNRKTPPKRGSSDTKPPIPRLPDTHIISHPRSFVNRKPNECLYIFCRRKAGITRLSSLQVL